MDNIARFGVFELDIERRQLHRKGVQIKLQHQPYEILRLLVTRSGGEWVSREEIRQALWPEGHFVDFERSINTAVMRLRQALRENTAAPAYIETVAGIGYRFIPPVVYGPLRADKNEIHSIAILPLKDLYGSSETEYFVDGITDAIGTALAVLSDLRVVSRASMRRYKDSKNDVRQIAREVEAQALIEGSILRSEDHIRITLRLLDAREDRHLWAHTYERGLNDILFLEEEIAEAIIRQVTKSAVRSSPAQPRQISPRAYELFLRGNFILSGRNPKLTPRAAEYYENAIFLEPEWAPPLAALGECFRIQEFYNYPSSKMLLERARALTEKALRIDSKNAQANATSAALLAFYDWKWDAAIEKIRFAQRADPQSPHIEFIYSQIMLHLGQFDSAISHVNEALAIDPSSLLLWSYRAQIHLLARRYEECIQESERLLAQNPDFAMALLNYAAALGECGRLEESLPAFDKVFAGTEWLMALIGRMRVHLLLGNSAQATADMDLLLKYHQNHACSPGMLASGYAVARNRDKALACVEAGVAEHDSRLSVFFNLPQYDFLREDERFQRALRQMRLRD